MKGLRLCNHRHGADARIAAKRVCGKAGHADWWIAILASLLGLSLGGPTLARADICVTSVGEEVQIPIQTERDVSSSRFRRRHTSMWYWKWTPGCSGAGWAAILRPPW